jgi:A/G-specific adenine glycosylase
MPPKDPDLAPERVASLRSSLLDWYRRHRRDLPWRRTRDPYRIWVSETMLQQTQVKTVLPYYERFLARFPDVSALALATEEDLLAAWSGLGYYSRARNLQAAVREVRARYGGCIPEDPEAFGALPGVGRYTAGAVLSIAFGKPCPAVDGNVARVLSRLFALRGDPRRGEASARLWEIAAALVPADAPSEFNQGLMEVGALVCTPRTPSCLLCPLREACEAHRLGREERFPEKAARLPSRPVKRAAAYVTDGSGRVLLIRRVEGRLLEGLWEFPSVDGSGEGARRALAKLLRDRVGVSASIGEEALEVRHSILERRIRVAVFRARFVGRAPARSLPSDARLVDREAWESLALAASARKIFRAMGKQEPRRS